MYVLRRSLQHRGTRTLFKSDTTFRSHLNALEPTKQNGIVYKIPCECGRVHISETARSMRERIKEHDRDIRFARTQTSAVVEHANETGHIPVWCKAKFIGRDPYWYTRRVKEAIYIWLHPNNFNGNSGIEIPKAWKPRIKQHNNRSMRTYEGMQSNNRNNNDDQNAPITANQRAKKIAACKSSTSSPDED